MVQHLICPNWRKIKNYERSLIDMGALQMILIADMSSISAKTLPAHLVCPVGGYLLCAGIFIGSFGLTSDLGMIGIKGMNYRSTQNPNCMPYITLYVFILLCHFCDCLYELVSRNTCIRS